MNRYMQVHQFIINQVHDFWIMNGSGECPKLPIYMYVGIGGRSRKSIKHSQLYKVFFSQKILPNFSTITNNQCQSDLAAARMAAERQVDNFVQPAIPRFDCHYDHWVMMENFLRSKEFFDMVETGYVEPNEGEVPSTIQQQRLASSKLKDLKVKNYLFQSIDQTILETMLQKKTSKEI